MTTPWIKKTFIGAATAIALAGGLAYAADVAPQHFHGGPPAGDLASREAMMLAHIGKTLQLDATQSAKLKTLGDLLAAQRSAMSNGTDPHARVAALIAGNTFDRAGAQQLVDEKTVQVKTAAPKLIAATGDFFDSLNAAQQQQVRDFLAAHHHGPDGMHHHHGAPDAASTN